MRSSNAMPGSSPRTRHPSRADRTTMLADPAVRRLSAGGVLLQCLGFVGCRSGGNPAADDALLTAGARLLSALAPEAVRTVRLMAAGLHVVAVVATLPDQPRDRHIDAHGVCLLVCGMVCGAGGLGAWANAVAAGDWQRLTGQDGTYCAVAWYPQQGELALGQDRFGLRPQYSCTRLDGSQWFASSPRALAVLPELADPIINWDAQILQTLRLPREGGMAVFHGLTRSRGADGVLIRSGNRIAIVHTPPPPYGDPPSGSMAVPALVDALNHALLARLRETLDQTPSPVPTGLLLSGGLDSRWIGAALRHLGRPYTGYTLGGRLDADVDFARRACTLHGVPLIEGDLDRHAATLAQVPATVWWQDGAISPYHHLIGQAWPALTAQGPMLLHGYFQDWLKWGRPRPRELLPQALAPRIDANALRTRAEGIYREFAQASHLAVLAPDSPGRVHEAIQRRLADRALAAREDAVSMLVMDHGPQEPFTALGRFGYALGGAAFPLLGQNSLHLVRLALRLPPHQRMQIQARCVLALAPEEARLPTMRFCLPTAVLAKGYGALPGHLLRDPGWYRRWRAIARHPSPETTRLARLRAPDALAWARGLLFATDSQALDHFGERLEAFWQAATAPDAHWRAVSLLYGLAGREYYRRCWRRAAAGDARPWVSEPGPERMDASAAGD